MSLTAEDLSEIRSIVQEVVSPLDNKLDNLVGQVEALENDVKEIYEMIAKLQRDQQSTNKFLKLSIEDKILKTYKELILTAKQAGVTLPKN